MSQENEVSMCNCANEAIMCKNAIENVVMRDLIEDLREEALDRDQEIARLKATNDMLVTKLGELAPKPTKTKKSAKAETPAKPV
jgi:hypothetical protein